MRMAAMLAGGDNVCDQQDRHCTACCRCALLQCSLLHWAMRSCSSGQKGFQSLQSEETHPTVLRCTHWHRLMPMAVLSRAYRSGFIRISQRSEAMAQQLYMLGTGTAECLARRYGHS